MNPNITLGEVKAHCADNSKKYGDACCDNCEFRALECCNAPETWNLDDHTPTNTEVMCDDGPMTVRKLIAYLSLCNPDYPIFFEGYKIESIAEYKDVTAPDNSRVELS